MKNSNKGRRFLSALFLLVIALCAASSAGAQSISDLNWAGFKENLGEPEVQTHTDPFASGVSAAEDLMVEDLQLSGIVYASPEDSYALISGYLVKPGDLIAGYRVDAVEKDRVRLKRLEDIFVLVLGGGI